MRFEVAVVPVGVDPQEEFLGIGLGVELGGVDVFADAEHLYRTRAAGDEQGGAFRRGVDRLLVTEQHVDSRGKVHE